MVNNLLCYIIVCSHWDTMQLAFRVFVNNITCGRRVVGTKRTMDRVDKYGIAFALIDASD